MDTLFTDKTGTLTIGRITFMRALGANGVRSAEVLRLGLLSCDTAIAGRSGAVDANPLDAATVRSPSAEALLAEVGRCVLFFRSRPSLPLTLAALGVVTIGVLLPLSPLASVLGFAAPPGAFFVVIIGLVLAYLALAQAGTWLFYRLGTVHGRPPVRQRRIRRVRRRMAHFDPSGRGRHLTPHLPWRPWTARPSKVRTLAPAPSRPASER